MSFTLYRRGDLGKALENALKELKNENKITDSIINKTLETFDKLMCEEISVKNKNKKCNIRGKVTSFRNCDDIWIFNGKEMILKSDRDRLSSKALKIVACDVNLRQQNNQG